MTRTPAYHPAHHAHSAHNDAHHAHDDAHHAHGAHDDAHDDAHDSVFSAVLLQPAGSDLKKMSFGLARSS